MAGVDEPGVPTLYEWAGGLEPLRRMIDCSYDITPVQRHRFAATMSLAADDAALPADPELRAAIIGYLEWGARLAMESSWPGAQSPARAPTPRWGWGVAPPYLG